MIERLRDCQSREDKRSCLPPRDAHRQDTHKNESERSGLSSPCHSAEFLGGVHEQRLNLIGAAALDSAEVAARRVGLIYPDILAAEHIDRIFGPHGALAFAHLREPEIGMGMVRRSGVKIDIELKGNMHWLKISITLVDRWHENLPDPFCIGLEHRSGLSYSLYRLRAASGLFLSLHKCIAKCWHLLAPGVSQRPAIPDAPPLGATGRRSRSSRASACLCRIDLLLT
jgi:hypothetical protein